MNILCRLLLAVCLSCLILALIFKKIELKSGSLQEKANNHLLIYPMIVSSCLPNQILYKVNIFGRRFLLNLTEFDYYDNRHRNYRKSVNSILSSNFIVQHLGGNERETYLEQTKLNQSSNNSCLYNGYFYSADEKDHFIVRGSALLDICRGLSGFFDLNIGYIVIEPLISQSSPHLHVPDGQPHLFYRYGHSSQSAEILTYEELFEHHDLEQQPDSLFNLTNLLSSGRDRKINKRSSIGSISHEYTVEVMVVADSYMKEYHGSNVENYILSLMSIAATVYKHPSLEAAINVILVRLVVLDNEKVGPRITNNVQETLRHFCHWQQSLNDKDEYSSNHHDVAILLTRLDMCRAPGKCDTLGLAELGTMCDFERSCTIIEDNGLSAAFTIAHELGHTFNIPHDDEKKCSDYMSLDSFNFHIMAPTLEYNTHPWSWSSCSMNLLHYFLSSEKATCLFNKPFQQMYVDQTSINAAPGLNFSVNQQCQYVFGLNSELCPYMPVCKLLWCTSASRYRSYSGCRTQHTPWADGTPCSQEKWCYRGECVGIAPHQLESVDGSWGSWQDWSPCSRSCGGGVERSGRDCDSPRPENGGKYCIGVRIRSRSCNLQECPSDSVDFRDAQCSQFNKNHTIPHVASSVQWIPKIVGVQRKDMCKLLCSLEHRPEFYVLKPKVVDGTSCGTDFDGICIDGVCEDAGCDGIVGSALLRDSCGVCGGDDSTCRLITNLFNGKTSYGYNLVSTLPLGASKLEIRQTSWNGRSDDDNYLVLITGKGKFLLNGHFQVSVFPQQVRFGDSLIAYSGSDNVVEKINFTKPLKERLKLYVLSVGQLKSSNITWQYLISEASSVSKYEWRYSTEWAQCNSTCNGSKERKIICIDISSNQAVKDNSCYNIPTLTKQFEACNIHCKLRWAVKSSSTCSVSCGPGLRTYVFSCIAENFHGHNGDELEDDAHCQNIPKPPETISCYADCSGYNWIYSNWTECSSSCGIGVKIRKMYCVDGTNRSIDRIYCEHLPVEVLEKTCQNLECPSWKYGVWSECSKTCDSGVQMRSALCKSINDEVLEDKFCDLGSKNDTHRSCSAELCTKWTFGSWSQCAQTCGTSTAFRTAVCTDSRGQNVDDSKCLIMEKITFKTCARSPCPSLLIGEWSTCSVTCGGGSRTRMIRCVNISDSSELDFRACSHNQTQYYTQEPCNTDNCPFWKTDSWTTCSTDCPGTRRRTIFCIEPAHNATVLDQKCNASDKPLETSSCENKCRSAVNDSVSRNIRPEKFTWIVGNWSTCSQTCGQGYKIRNVMCQSTVIPVKIVADDVCQENQAKPSNRELCIHKFCGRWFIGEWKQCPATCGRNLTQFRSVSCVGSDVVPHSEWLYCDMSKKPSSQRSCNVPLCTGYSDGSTSHLTPENSFKGWRVGLWSDCSATCGGGFQQRLVFCDTGDINGCHSFDRPLAVQTCGHQTCPQWIVGDWNDCSETCGQGFQERVVECLSPEDGQVLPPENCSNMDMPSKKQSCFAKMCDDTINGVWRAEKWSKCSTSCGRGRRSRRVLCVDEKTSLHIDHNLCLSKRPPQKKICRLNRCPKWKRHKWTKCSTTCGDGYRTRNVYCVVGRKQKRIKDGVCNKLRKPIQKATCRMQTCPQFYRWRPSNWSTCKSEPCSRIGRQTREISCMNRSGQVVSNLSCISLTPPSVIKLCESSNFHCHYRWLAGLWTKCTTQCGSGFRYRKTYCIDAHKKVVERRRCIDSNLRPPRRRQLCESRIQCNLKTCSDVRNRLRIYLDGLYDLSIVGNHTTKIYCYGMNDSSRLPLEYVPLKHLDYANYAEFYGKRLLKPFACPYGGLRNDSCDCTSTASHIKPGLTRFRYLRVDLNYLRIMTSDYRFAVSDYGHFVPFATAGDCYSAINCPQGRFNIDLRQTGFRISNITMWKSDGHRITMKINKFENYRVIDGQCGGFCGACYPDHRIGLVVEPDI